MVLSNYSPKFPVYRIVSQTVGEEIYGVLTGRELGMKELQALPRLSRIHVFAVRPTEGGWRRGYLVRLPHYSGPQFPIC